MKKIIIGSVILFALTAPAYCGQNSRIELKDGRVIEAEIITYDNSVYTLNAGSLGQIRVDAANIKNIGMLGPQPITAGNISGPIDAGQIKTQADQIKQKVEGNPEIMKIVTSLVGDPEFQEIMKDQGIVNAAQSGNIAALMANPKFMNLLNHPKMKEIESKLNAGPQ